jgi:hypothetical protein
MELVEFTNFVTNIALCGMDYKHIAIVNDASRAISDAATWCVAYDPN